jgi:pimeloyl-ACP methyl ester carboxylesterase
MRLELISRSPDGPARPTPLLFVHGANSGAWVWDRHFLPYFASRGYDSHALSLRGHGRSEGRPGLPFHRLRDYVDDLERTVAGFDRPPVVVGHSMGGMVVQKLLQRRPLPGAVLLAPVPPHGLLGSVLGVALTNPGFYFESAWAQWLGPSALNGSVRRALFSPDTSEEDVRTYVHQFQPESSLVALDLLGLDLPPSRPRHDVPVLVLGAADDGLVFPDAISATARAYGAESEVLPGLSHAMMLDHGWERVAGRVAGWLDATEIGSA